MSYSICRYGGVMCDGCMRCYDIRRKEEECWTDESEEYEEEDEEEDEEE